VASRKRVTVCCTGNPTSTFGGGGGTKLFCSQPVSKTKAAMAKHRRQAFAAPGLAAPSGLQHAGERVGFIPVPQSVLFSKGSLIQKEALLATP
jgi:hypothetical protein